MKLEQAKKYQKVSKSNLNERKVKVKRARKCITKY